MSLASVLIDYPEKLKAIQSDLSPSNNTVLPDTPICVICEFPLISASRNTIICKHC